MKWFLWRVSLWVFTFQCLTSHKNENLGCLRRTFFFAGRVSQERFFLESITWNFFFLLESRTRTNLWLEEPRINLFFSWIYVTLECYTNRKWIIISYKILEQEIIMQIINCQLKNTKLNFIFVIFISQEKYSNIIIQCAISQLPNFSMVP